MHKVLSYCCLCGGSPIIRSKDPVHRSKFRFKCTGCGLTVDKGYPTREDAAEAWEAINAPKARKIGGVVVPLGYTLVPASIFKEACDYIRANNFVLFKSLAQYNIWHSNVPVDPPPIDVNGARQQISNE
jgi:hypothetical protein